MSPPDQAALALEFPDIARWVETRSMLLDRRAVLFGRRRYKGWHFAALDLANELVSIVGQPSPEAIAEAVRCLDEDGAVIRPQDDPIKLNGWRADTAILYEQVRRPPAMRPPAALARLLEPGWLPAGMPPGLREQLLRASAFSPIAATIVGDEPVSFCYGVSTETLWDVSIDTLEAFRGRGYAALAIDLMINLMESRGKRPVWGALESNFSSKRLAQKLGFVPTDRITVYARE